MRQIKKAYELEVGDYVRITESDFKIGVWNSLDEGFKDSWFYGEVDSVELESPVQLRVTFKCGFIYPSMEVEPDTLFKIVGED